MPSSIEELQEEIRKMGLMMQADPVQAATIGPRLREVVRIVRALQPRTPLAAPGETSGQVCIGHCVGHQVCNSHPQPPSGPILTAAQGGGS
jgi:hypothetical protein